MDKYKKYKNKYIKLKTKILNNMFGGDNIEKEIYFIRHGKTIWNDLGKTQGLTEPHKNFCFQKIL